MAWVVGGHDAEIDLDAQLPKLRSWFDRYLKNEPASPAAPAFSRGDRRRPAGRAERRLPAAAGADRHRVPARATGVVPTTIAADRRASRPCVNPPGGVPTALTSLPGTGEALAAATRVGGYPLAALPGQTATFTTDAADRAADPGRQRPDRPGRDLDDAARRPCSRRSGISDRTASAPRRGQPQTAVLPQRAVAPGPPHRADPGPAGHRPVALPAVAHQVPVGHRLQVVISSTDQAYAVPAGWPPSTRSRWPGPPALASCRCR